MTCPICGPPPDPEVLKETCGSIRTASIKALTAQRDRLHTIGSLQNAGSPAARARSHPRGVQACRRGGSALHFPPGEEVHSASSYDVRSLGPAKRASTWRRPRSKPWGRGASQTCKVRHVVPRRRSPKPLKRCFVLSPYFSVRMQAKDPTRGTSASRKLPRPVVQAPDLVASKRVAPASPTGRTFPRRREERTVGSPAHWPGFAARLQSSPCRVGGWAR